MLQRQPLQARFGFDISGITKEVCYSDIKFRGEDNGEDQAESRLDRIQFMANAESFGDGIDDDENSDAGQVDRLWMLEPASDPEEVEHDNDRETMIAALMQAASSLTDRQAMAVWLWANGRSERDSASTMGIKQATYQEILWGKHNVGGAIPKLRKYFQKHPVTSL